VLHIAHGRRHVLRYLGRAVYTMAPAIERFMEGLLPAEVEPGGLVFDLREARMLDSTNLGLMARLAARVENGSDEPRCLIVATSEDVTDVLRSMGMDSLFRIVSADPIVDEPGPEEEIVLEPTGQHELMRTMLEAHRVLAQIDSKDRDGLRAVVEGLEAELRTRQM
jgi:anti-anti-sigma regulatory factor